MIPLIQILISFIVILALLYSFTFKSLLGIFILTYFCKLSFYFI